MHISTNRKKMKIYFRFRDSKNGYKEVSLPAGLDSSISFLRYIFKSREYIEKGLATEADLERLIQCMRDETNKPKGGGRRE